MRCRPAAPAAYVITPRMWTPAGSRVPIRNDTCKRGSSQSCRRARSRKRRTRLAWTARNSDQVNPSPTPPKPHFTGHDRISERYKVWDGWIVVDVDASVVESHSDKQGAAPTYKKHVYGLHPIVVSVANTSEILAVLLRDGNAGSNTVVDHVAVLTDAIAQIPARYRKKIVFRADGAGATKELLAWIKTEAAERGYTWHYSVGFDVTEGVRTAITTVPARTWVPALTPEGEIRRGAHTTEITGLLKLADGWPEQMRITARTEPLHPRHRKQASEVEKRRGQRFQAVATDLPGHHYPKLDAFHRNHAGVETVIKDAKNLGLKRLPSYYFAFNQAWCAAVTIAADLLSWLRLLTLDHHPTLTKATPDTLRRTLLDAPARLVHHARRRLIRLPADHPHHDDLTHAWQKIRALPT